MTTAVPENKPTNDTIAEYIPTAYRQEPLVVHDRETHFRMTDIDFIRGEQIIDETDLFKMLSSTTLCKGTSHDYDNTPYSKQGIVYSIATCNGTKKWENPCETNKIKLSSFPGTNLGNIEDVLLNEIGQWYPDSNPNSQVTIDFRPSNILISPTHYTMSYYRDGHGYLTRSWKLMGSNDGEHFEIIKEHVNDETMTEQNPTVTWPIICSRRYSVFRIQVTGLDSSQSYYFLTIRYFLMHKLTIIVV
jgi:hypothetical protein